VAKIPEKGKGFGDGSSAEISSLVGFNKIRQVGKNIFIGVDEQFVRNGY
jgi:hypothetical protein